MAKFYNFTNGLPIGDITINTWIRKCLDLVVKGEPHWSISSGDTCVITMRYDSEIQVIVANSNGKSTMRFSTSPGYEDAIEFEEYVRPVSPVKELVCNI